MIHPRKAGVIGWPVSHSLSPCLHSYWLRQYGINGAYAAHEVRPEELKEFLRSLEGEGFAGVNVTLPHKERALDLVDEVDAQAQRIGAVNTVVIRGGKTIGYNTDAYGFIQNLKAADVALKGARCLVLGAGGAARAVCAGLMDEGCEITLANRTREKAEALAGNLPSRLREGQGEGSTIKVIDWNGYENAMRDVSLLVNTTSLGMKGNQKSHSREGGNPGQGPRLRGGDKDSRDIKLGTLPAHATVTDIVYNPLMTPLLSAAKARGNSIVDGLGMLLWQAQPAFEMWFGVKPQVTDELRDHAVKAMV